MVAKRLGGARRLAGPLAVGVALLAVFASGASAFGATKEGPRDGPFSNGAEQTTKGWIYMATPESGRATSFSTTNGLAHYLVQVTPEAPFLLTAQDPGNRACVLGACYQTNDFDVVFLHEFDDGSTRVVSRQYNVGDEEGRVPSTASLGLIYLRTPGPLPSLSGYGFVYYEGLAGHDKLPDEAGQ